MSAPKIEPCQRLLAHEESNGILLQHYELIIQRMRGTGLEFDPAAPKSALLEFWQHSDDYLPPTACV